MKHRALSQLLGRTDRWPGARELARPTIEGKTVLITGAGGSIATELTRQVARLNPRKVVLLNHSELALFNSGAAELAYSIEVVCACVDVRNDDHVGRVFADHRPDVTFHAAAMKHVPLCEENPCAAVLTNVFGTRNVLRHAAANASGLGTFAVVVSTDKAVEPTSVMGATKRIAEKIAGVYYSRPKVVRFGNVIGSSGSVLPMFKRQLAEHGELHVTHPEVTRYFMTAREAVDLILAATTLPQRLFVFDMGKPVRIADLARRYADASGYAGAEIHFTGLRPGEKLTEALATADEHLGPTAVPGILAAELDEDVPLPLLDLKLLEARAGAGDAPGTLRLLWELAR